MKLITKKLLTIICESAIENFVIEDIKKAGARGYTIIEAKGEGHSGIRSGDWDQNRNIKIEIICNADTTGNILEVLYKKYYNDYAIISFVSDVDIIRENKF